MNESKRIDMKEIIKEADMFTDKAKEKFEAWYPIIWVSQNRGDYLKYPIEVNLKKFYRKCLAEQWGVILEFSDSEGYCIQMSKASTWIWWIQGGEAGFYSDTLKYKTRKEAQQEAIKKLNELLNK